MKLVILTQYYPPEIGAPQNRLHDLAVRLRDKGVDVIVLTGMPNYPHMEVHPEYKHKLYFKERIDGIPVHRSWLWVKNARRNIALRILCYLSFTFTSLLIGAFKLPRLDFILCESPPLSLGLTGLILARLKSGRFILNIADIWPDGAVELGVISEGFLVRLTRRFEKWIYRKSDLISGQTRGIGAHVKKHFPEKHVHLLRNGVDLSMFEPAYEDTGWRKKRGFSKSDRLFLFGGILGFLVGLEVVLYAADKLRDHRDIKFLIFGQGPEKEGLIALKNELMLNNIFFFDPVPRSAMPEMISACDVGLMPMRRAEFLKGAIPSKSFEYLAMERPILLGAEGEAKELLIDDAGAGLAFEPENPDDLAEKVLLLSNAPDLRKKLGTAGRKAAKLRFDRAIIAERFFDFLNQRSR